MNIEEIKSILDCHYINCLFAEEIYTQGGKTFFDWVDMTGWSKKAIMEWLNY